MFSEGGLVKFGDSQCTTKARRKYGDRYYENDELLPAKHGPWGLLT